ncbi:hypothetical protein Esti_006545 [Eimeria stiedai]
MSSRAAPAADQWTHVCSRGALTQPIRLLADKNLKGSTGPSRHLRPLWDPLTSLLLLRMRLCLLAVGALTGAPSLSWGFHADAKAALMGIGAPLALLEDETPQASLSMLAPSVSSASFVGVSAPILPRMQNAQAARRVITESLRRARSPAAEQMMKRISPGAARPIAPQPPSVTPGAAAPCPPPAAPPSKVPPAARLPVRRGAVRRRETEIKPPVVAAAAKAPLVTPAVSPGAILSKYIRAIATGRPPPKGPPKAKLSEEELKAAKEVALKQEEQFKQQIVAVVQENIADAEQRKAAAGANEPQTPLEREAMVALNLMTGARAGTKEVVLRDIREVTTDRQVVPQCLGAQTKVLGVGGMAVVVQLDLVDEECKKALAIDKFAVKAMYVDFEGRNLGDNAVQVLRQRIKELYEAETEPLKLLAAAAKPGQSVKETLKENHWAVPGYSASAGDPDQLFTHNGLLFSSNLLLSELMLGDGFKLLYFRGYTPGARVSMPVREYICGQMIKSTAKLHEIGLAHYDIKPDNILLGRDGSVNLADFGMCGPVNVPKPCGVGITTLYADPEQVKCLRKGGLLSMNPRYDSWSLGMTCYLMMTTSGLPYKIRNSDEMLEHISSLDTRSIFRSATGHGNPEQELKDAGASPLWAQIVSELLTIPRNRRPTPLDILKKYPDWKYGTD